MNAPAHVEPRPVTGASSADQPVGVRTTVVWVPDWPVAAAMAALGVDAHVPAAVHDGRRVVATSATARAAGVRRGMRRRLAQGCCPELVLLPRDETRDVVAFEQVACACERVVAGVEVVRPGLLLLPAGGAARYHGSEQALADALVETVASGTCGPVDDGGTGGPAGGAGHECGVGTADGLLAAVLAARSGAVVPPGGSAVFLAPLPIGSLSAAAVSDDQTDAVRDLVGLLVRLGIHTLGGLAALPRADVAARFGRVGTWAHTLAGGADLRPPARRRVEPDLMVADDLDPPVERADQTAFAGRRLAERLHTLLVTRGLTCGRLRITARTEGGTELTRVWHADAATGGLAPARITDRVRWQTEGWLAGDDGPTSGLVRLELAALDVVVAGAQQPGLWGSASGADVRAHRALDRVQQLVGGDGVRTARLQGGRYPGEQVHQVTWGSDEPSDRPVDRPWPGRLPDPVPSSVLAVPHDVVLLDAAGRTVRLDPRGWLDGTPVTMRLAPAPEEGPPGARRGRSRDTPGRDHDDDAAGAHRLRGRLVPAGREVLGWAGPWPSPPRWWRADVRSGKAVVDGDGARSRGEVEHAGSGALVEGSDTWAAHLQVLLADAQVLLLVGGLDGWTWVATYD